LSIHEYLSADLLRKSGVGVPYGAVATTAAEAEAIAKEIGGDDMVSLRILEPYISQWLMAGKTEANNTVCRSSKHKFLPEDEEKEHLIMD
jgi:hypothetical protein